MLVGRPTIAALIGVTTERVRQITKVDAEFPAAHYQFGRQPVWDLDEVVAWADGKGRNIDPSALQQVRTGASPKVPNGDSDQEAS